MSFFAQSLLPFIISPATNRTVIGTSDDRALLRPSAGRDCLIQQFFLQRHKNTVGIFDR